MNRILDRIKCFLKALIPIILFAISLGYFIYTKVTGSTLLKLPSIDEMRSYGPLILPFIYTVTYVARAWAALLFAYILAGFISEFIPKHILMNYLSSTRVGSYLLAVLLSPLLTVCSCVMIPVFAGLVYSGAGIGPAISFLLAAPAVNVMAIILTIDLISWRIATARFIAASTIAILVGYIIARTPWARKLEERFKPVSTRTARVVEVERPLHVRLWHSFIFSSYLAKMILPYILLGIAVVSYVHAYLPPTIVSIYFRGFSGIILGALIGIPMYTPTCVEVFLINALKHLGMAPSAALAFLIGGPMTSIPSMLGVSRIIGWRIVILYTSLAAIGAITAGTLYYFTTGDLW